MIVGSFKNNSNIEIFHINLEKCNLNKKNINRRNEGSGRMEVSHKATGTFITSLNTCRFSTHYIPSHIYIHTINGCLISDKQNLRIKRERKNKELLIKHLATKVSLDTLFIEERNKHTRSNSEREERGK